MYEIKNGTTAYLPVRFFDQSGIPLSGVPYTTVSATLLKSNNTSVLVTPASGADWIAVTFGDFSDAGVYLLRVDLANINVNGFLTYAVSTSVIGAKKHVGVVNVVAKLENDTFVDLGTLTTTATGIKAKTDNLPSDPADASDVAAAITAATGLLATSAALTSAVAPLATSAGVTSATSPLATAAALTAAASNITSIKTKTDALPADIPAAIWDATLASYSDAGSTGEALGAAGAASVDEAAIATAVWNKALTGYATAGQAGTLVKESAANIVLIKAKTDNLPADVAASLTSVSDKVTRALGLMHENSLMDATNFDGDNNLVSARLRTYDTKANTEAAAASSPSGGTTGLVATYNVTSDYIGGNLTKYTVVKT